MSYESIGEQLPNGIPATVKFDASFDELRDVIAHEQVSRTAYVTLSNLGRTMIQASQKEIYGLEEIVQDLEKTASAYDGELANVIGLKGSLPAVVNTGTQALAFEISKLEATDYSPAQPNMVLFAAFNPEDEEASDRYLCVIDIDQPSEPVMLYRANDYTNTDNILRDHLKDLPELS